MKLMIMTLLAVAFLEGHALAKDSYITFIMDRSASMRTQRVDGKTRCAFSKDFTRQTLNKLYERYAADGTVYINLELFGSQGGQQSLTQGFNKDRTLVLAAIDRLASEACEQSSTALADAMCSAANGMRNLTAGLDSNLIVFGITDGEENSSSFRDCGPNLAAGWQPGSEPTSRPWPIIDSVHPIALSVISTAGSCVSSMRISIPIETKSDGRSRPGSGLSPRAQVQCPARCSGRGIRSHSSESKPPRTDYFE